ncbi:MAG: glycosyltransferase [Sulfuricella sp.]|nr:glycosyltransferase [Sulfuricella sp.]
MGMDAANVNQPMVSVCIANYNGMGIIDACIASVRAQDCDCLVEIIVHDDASTDGSARYIRDRHPDIILIESDENVGFCVSNNRMASSAQGEYLLLLNNDAELFPDALKTLLCEALRLGQSAILGLPQYDATTGELIDMGSTFDPFLNPVPNLDPNLQEVAMVIGACLWIPKVLWDELGGFPEWFGSIAEDMYLSCRARLAGHTVRALSVSGYRHWQGKSFSGNRVADNRLSTTFRRRALSERNKSLVMVMIYPAPWIYPMLFLHLLLLLLEGGLLTIAKRDRRFWHEIYAPCFLALWRKRHHLRKMRGNIQKNRCISAMRFFSVFTWAPHKLRMLLRHGLPQVR